MPDLHVSPATCLLRQFRGFEGRVGLLRSISLGLGVVLPDELGRLGLPFYPTYFKDLDHLGVGHEVPKAFLIPVENHPHPVIVIRIAKNV
jgi:hypothetical protein